MELQVIISCGQVSGISFDNEAETVESNSWADSGLYISFNIRLTSLITF